MTALLIIIGIVVGLILLWIAIIFVTSLVETQHVYDLVPLPTGPQAAPAAAIPPGVPVPLNYGQPQDYLTIAAARAAQFGYTHAGEYREISSPVRVSLWLSPDRTTIAQIAFGTTLKLPVKRTRLLSRLGNGRVLVTTDAPGLVDFTAMLARQVIMDGDFDALHARHTAWIAAAAGEGLLLAFGQHPFEESKAIEVERAMRLEAFGYARFVDRNRGTYHFTLKGALMNCTVGIWIGLREANASRK
jgi:hypothetical protein